MKSAYFTTLGVAAAILTILALATLVLPGAAGRVTAGDGNGGREFRAELTGDQEVSPPAPAGGVITVTTGEAKLTFNGARTELEFELEVEDGVRVTQAHIHCAPEGVNGPIVVFLAGFHDKGWDVDGDWIGDATATNANITNAACGSTLAELAEAMAAGNAYVNVHTVANPAGEVRGQVEGEEDEEDEDD